MLSQPELLAPAGSFEALVAAVQNGADAVYLGGPKFNARHFASNFTKENLREAVIYAHTYGVRVYITVNILIKEKELDELREYLHLLESCHVDGVIVQDIGAAYVILSEFPSLSLHASTQMTIHQLEGVKFLERMGFERAVLSRELTLEELDYISKNSILDIESFIHGALCISYSGQCLFSSLIGGRSGNRGMCAQPCRLPYMIDNKQSKDDFKYYISPKDLSSASFIKEILDSGVKSLKIEGRMKRPEYVAVVTKVYREILDKINWGEKIEDFSAYEKELMQIFNRGGFTKGYYFKNDKSIISINKPNNWGLYCGKALKTQKGYIYIEAKEKIETGDSIEFRTADGVNTGQVVESIRVNGRPVDVVSPGEIAAVKAKQTVEKGTSVYKLSSVTQLKDAQKTFSNIYQKKIPLMAEAVFKSGFPPKLILTDYNGVTVSVMLNKNVDIAKNRPVTSENIEAQLKKLGDTPYEILEISIDMDDNIFIPLKDINALRRNAIDEMNRRRIDIFESAVKEKLEANQNIAFADDETTKNTNTKRIGITSKGGNEETSTKDFRTDLDADQHFNAGRIKLSGYVSSLDYPMEVYSGLDIINYDPYMWPDELDKLKENVDRLKSGGFTVRLVMPRIARQEDMDHIKSTPDCIWTMFDGYVAGNLGIVSYLNGLNVRKITGGYSLNVYNSESVRVLSYFGLTETCLSVELTTGEIRDIIKKSILPCEILVFGSLPLMIMDHNLEHDYLYDRKGYRFRVNKRKVSRSYTEIMNSNRVFPVDSIDKVQSLGGLNWGLVLSDLTPDSISSVIKLYRHFIDNPNGELSDELTQIIEKIKREGFTKGHLFRGVK